MQTIKIPKGHTLCPVCKGTKFLTSVSTPEIEEPQPCPCCLGLGFILVPLRKFEGQRPTLQT